MLETFDGIYRYTLISNVIFMYLKIKQSDAAEKLSRKLFKNFQTKQLSCKFRWICNTYCESVQHTPELLKVSTVTSLIAFFRAKSIETDVYVKRLMELNDSVISKYLLLSFKRNCIIYNNGYKTNRFVFRFLRGN